MVSICPRLHDRGHEVDFKILFFYFSFTTTNHCLNLVGKLIMDIFNLRDCKMISG